MNMLFHCAHLPSISVYYLTVNSSKILNTFATSPLQELRVITKCIAGYVSPSFDENLLSLLHFSTQEAEALVSIFCRAANSDSRFAKFDGGFYKISLLLIAKAINNFLLQQSQRVALNLQLVEFFEVLNENFQQFFCSLLAVMKNGSRQEIVVLCQLLWSLMNVDTLRAKVQKNSEIVFQEMMKLKRQSDNLELKSLCHCVTLALEDGWLNGKHVYIMYIPIGNNIRRLASLPHKKRIKPCS